LFGSLSRGKKGKGSRFPALTQGRRRLAGEKKKKKKLKPPGKGERGKKKKGAPAQRSRKMFLSRRGNEGGKWVRAGGKKKGEYPRAIGFRRLSADLRKEKRDRP